MTESSQKYDNTIKYLYGLQKHGIKLGLSNTESLMNLLGGPHRAFRSIHIAGTNGKGSTAAALASILKESGLRVGLFTSPHLVSFTERIQINGKRITESEVIGYGSYIRNLVETSGLNPTFFELVTAMALYYFAENNIEWAVVETGMGGRLDSTNVIKPDITIITNISLDHCEFLGGSISDITREKAGIIKPEVPVITSSGLPDVINHLTNTAESNNAPMHIYGKDFSGTLLEMNDRQINFDYKGYDYLRELTAGVSGKYQIYNVSIAVRACEILNRKRLSISEDAIRIGLRNIKLEGRLEWVSESPPIIVDGAHNPAAADALTESLKDIFPDKKIILITGIMDDKDVKGILLPLIRSSESLILTRAKYERAAPPDKLENMVTVIKETGVDFSPASIHNTDTVAEAIGLAKTKCGKDSIILITGSFYTTGEAKEILGCDAVLPRLREYK